MTNITIKTEKSSHNEVQTPILPFGGYVDGIKDEEVRKDLQAEMALALNVTYTTIRRFVNGVIRPNMLQRRELASVIRRHSGDSSWTGDKLFPVEFYEKKE